MKTVENELHINATKVVHYVSLLNIPLETVENMWVNWFLNDCAERGIAIQESQILVDTDTCSYAEEDGTIHDDIAEIHLYGRGVQT